MEVMTGGCKEGAKRFFVAGDLNIDFCMDEDDEMKETYVSKCWYGIDADLRKFKKAKYMELMKEFNCKASSTWLSFDD